MSDHARDIFLKTGEHLIKAALESLADTNQYHFTPVAYAAIIAEHIEPLIARERVEALGALILECDHCGGEGYYYQQGEDGERKVGCYWCSWVRKVIEKEEAKAKGDGS